MDEPDNTQRPRSVAGQGTHERLLCQVWQLQQPNEVCRYLRNAYDGRITTNAQLGLIACLRNSTHLRYPPGQNYCSRLLRVVMLAIEEDGETVEDEIADLHMLNLSGKCPQSTEGSLPLAPGWCYKTYAYRAPPKAPDCTYQASDTIEPSNESQASGGQSGLITLRLALNLFEGATGCHEWEAGFKLTEFVLSYPDLFRGRRCVELGCGTGMVGVALCRIGAAAVQLTDGNAAAVHNCRHNLEINQCVMPEEQDCQLRKLASSQTQHVQVMEMQWEDPSDLHPDVILAADVLYDPAAIQPMIQLLTHFLKEATDSSTNGHPAAYIATTLRNEATLQRFLRDAAASDLLIVDISAQAREGNERAKFPSGRLSTA